MDTPTPDIGFLEWLIGGACSAFALVVGHLHMRISSQEERMFSEMSKRDETSEKQSDKVWTELQRQQMQSEQFRDRVLGTMVTRDDMRADLKALKDDLLDAIKSRS